MGRDCSTSHHASEWRVVGMFIRRRAAYDNKSVSETLCFSPLSDLHSGFLLSFPARLKADDKDASEAAAIIIVVAAICVAVSALQDFHF